MEQKLLKPKYQNLKINQIHPQGWLRRQLEIQAEGLCGNLDLFWPDIRDSKWIGGTGDGWERVPYWLDGFIPLAYLLNNEDMKNRAKTYIDAILDRQQKDGWICPCTTEERSQYDIWSLFLVLKVLILYEDVTDDNRIEKAVYKALKSLERHIDYYTLNGWAQMRWFECFLAIIWMYQRRPEEWLIELAVKLKSQGFDYKNLFDHFPYKNGVEKNMWSLMSHGVNLAMALKSKALEYLFDKNIRTLEYTDYMLEQLERYHGMVTGVFSSDECLAGKNPVQGTELCVVTEMMYSLEVLIAISGKGEYGDLLEKIAFNALPAALSPDMWSHQYDQQVNQINCIESENPVFNTNKGDSNLFGLEPHYGCCTANFAQGWPKLVLSAIMQEDEGLYIISYVPNLIETTVKGTKVILEVQGDYPFQDQVTLVLKAEKAVEFSLKLRIPQYAYSAKINCDEVYMANPGEIFTLKKIWEGENRIDIAFFTNVVFEHRPDNLVALRRGPLIFSLKIPEKWVQVHKEEPGKEAPHCDYEVHANGEWRYGIADTYTEIRRHPVGRYPFSPENPPIELGVKCVRIDWKEENTYAARKPASRQAKSAICMNTFIPYGCTNIRMTELPYIEEVKEK